jgi:hypothetical protein
VQGEENDSFGACLVNDSPASKEGIWGQGRVERRGIEGEEGGGRKEEGGEEGKEDRGGGKEDESRPREKD